ncbi:hypothetical protein [Mesobacillus jeotgali]|nr:hypothetical protein [Mesobacillus jeotgali]
MNRDREQVDYENGMAHLFGLDEETSLQSVNFASTENPLLNEHYQEVLQK